MKRTTGNSISFLKTLEGLIAIIAFLLVPREEDFTSYLYANFLPGAILSLLGPEVICLVPTVAEGVEQRDDYSASRTA